MQRSRTTGEKEGQHTVNRMPASEGHAATRLVERPWGKFQQYAHNRTCTVSLMFVDAGQRLSLQSHSNRAELWIILDDGAEVQVGDRHYYPKAGEELWIERGERHRLSSTGPSVRVLEVAFGQWDQQDITRYEDDYGRD